MIGCLREKDVVSKLEDIDTKSDGSVILTGYFADFDSLDSDGDIFQKGSFKKTIKENGDRILHLLQHDTWKPMARPIVSEDSKGLRFESTIGSDQMQVGYISNTVKLYKAEVYNEHSVGFITMKEERNSGEDEPNIITEVKLFEGSTVTWGANPNTPFTGFKSMTKIEQLNEINKKIDYICKALRVGSLTDDKYIQLEIELKQLQALINIIEPGDTTPNNDEPQKELFDFLTNIKN